MPVYKGLVDRQTLRRVNDSRVRIALANNTLIQIEFPEDIRQAFVQATNWFPGDRVTSQALTAYTSDSHPRVMTFERLPDAGGTTHPGFFSFEVDTNRSVAHPKSEFERI